MHCGIRIRASDGLLECRQQVVLVLFLVIESGLLLHGFRDNSLVQSPAFIQIVHDETQRIERDAAVPSCHLCQDNERVLVVLNVESAKAFVLVCESSLEDRQDILIVQSLELVDVPDSAEDRVVDRKVRILCRASDELDDAVFDGFEQ